MENTKITGDKIRNHFTYSLWKYILFAVIAVFGWNLIYTSTAYRAPKNKRLDLYFVTYSVPDESLNWFKQSVLDLLPELEDSSCASVVYTEDDNYYGSIQLSTYMGAGEGDIYLMARDRYEAYVTSGVFIALDDAIADGRLDLRGIDVAGEVHTDENGQTGVFGIPADTLYGLYDQSVDARNMVICITAYSATQDQAIRYIDWLIETMHTEKPDWYIEYEASLEQAKTTPQISDMPSY